MASSCIVLHVHVLLKSCRSLYRSIYDFGFHLPRTPALNFPKKTNNPNPSPIGNKFGLFLFGPSGENRTHGLLNPIVLLSKTQCTIRYCLDSVSLNFKCIISFCFIGCQDVSFLLWSKGMPSLVYVKNFSSESSKESVKNRDNDDSCGSKTACQDPVKSRGINKKENKTEMNNTNPILSDESEKRKATHTSRLRPIIMWTRLFFKLPLQHGKIYGIAVPRFASWYSPSIQKAI